MKFLSTCEIHRKKMYSSNSSMTTGYNFLFFFFFFFFIFFFFFAESFNKGNTSVHMLQLFVFTQIEDIESEKETAVALRHEEIHLPPPPPPTVNPLQSCVSTCLECKVSIRTVEEMDQQPGLKEFHITNRRIC